ncbi:hypothetical protein Hanom_Chr06g00505971 [Helianthus anomalus]
MKTNGPNWHINLHWLCHMATWQLYYTTRAKILQRKRLFILTVVYTTTTLSTPWYANYASSA